MIVSKIVTWSRLRSQSRHLGRLFLLMAGAIAGVLVYFAVIFEGQLPDHPAVTGWNDLLLHFGAYSALSFFIFFGVGKVASAVLFSTAINAVMEALQFLVPDRTASLSDFVAGLLGTAAAWLVIRMYRLLTGRIG